MAKLVCPSCGEKIPLKDEKCPKCGYAMRPDFKALLKQKKSKEALQNYEKTLAINELDMLQKKAVEKGEYAPSIKKLLEESRVLILKKDYNKAIPIFTQVLEINPYLDEIWVMKGAALRSLGYHAEALKCYDQALNLDPTNTEARLAKDTIETHLKKLEASHPDKEIKLEDSTSSKICPNCGKEVSIEHLKYIEETNSMPFCKNCGARLPGGVIKGKTTSDRGEPRAKPIETDKVRQQIDETIRRRKTHEEFIDKHFGGNVIRGLQNAMLERQDRLSSIFQERYPFEGKDLKAPDLKGLDLLEQMNYPEAVKYYQSLVSKEAKNHRFWNNLGVAYMGMKNRKEALFCYDQSLKINQQYYIGWYNKGAVYYECKKFEEAVQYFDKTLELNPICGEAYNDRKIAREELGHFDFKLGEDFDLIGKGMNPLRARLNTSSALVDLGGGKDAILGSSKLVLKHNEKLKDVLDAGIVHEKNGNINSALANYEEGLELNPEDPVLWFHKARILALTNDIEIALTCIDNAIKYDPAICNPTLVAQAYKLRSALNLLRGQKAQALADLHVIECINPFDEELQELKKHLSKVESSVKEKLNREEIVELEKKSERLIYRGDYEEILDITSQILSSEPRSSAGWFWRGKALSALARDREAISCYVNADKIAGNMASFQNIILAKSASEGGRGRDMLRKKKGQPHPQILFSNADTYNEHGAYAQTLGQFEYALECFEEALKIDPNHELAKRNKERVVKLLKNEGYL